MRVVLIAHGDDPMDDRVSLWLARRGVAPEVRRPFRGEPLPAADGSVDASVIYGGPFDAFAHDRLPFLADEARWIEGCLGRNVPLLGICQGAQQIAHVLGGPVGPLDPVVHEFGYYPLLPTEAGHGLIPQGLHVAQSHWHGFALSAGAELLAASADYPVQAMRYGSAHALQFHAEVTPAGFHRWQARDWAPWGKPGVQSRERQDRLMALHDDAQDRWFNAFLDRIFADLTGDVAEPGPPTRS